MTAAAAKVVGPILRDADGEPPFGIGGLAFRDDQGEVFEHNEPRYRTPAARIAVVELENGKWLAGFRVDGAQFDSRAAALDAAIEAVVMKARQFMAAEDGEGTQWTEGFGHAVIAWALSLQAKDKLVQAASADAEASSDHPGSEIAASDADRVIEDSPNAHSGSLKPENAAAEISDPVVAELVAANRARKEFPAGHTFSMTNPVLAGAVKTVGTCTCKHIFVFPGGDHERMDAAIEAHLQKFDHLPEKIDGRGQPIGGEAAPAKPKRPRKRQQPDAPEGIPASIIAAALPQAALRSEPAPSLPPDGAGLPVSDDDAQRRTGLLIIKSGESPASEIVRDLIGIGYVHATTTKLIVTEEGEAFLQGAPIGAASPSSDGGGEATATAERPADTGDRLASPLQWDVTPAADPERQQLRPSPGTRVRKEAGIASGPSEADAKCTTCEAAPIGAALIDDDDLSIEWPSYQTFLEDKIVTAPLRGIEVSRDALHPWLKPHCRDLVVWALRLGCSAIFANFGLHKTAMQLEWCRQLAKHTGQPTLNVVPLGVRHGFIKEALQLDMDVRFIRTTAELDDLYCDGVRHFLTNYESIREGKLDPNQFGACSLDEASVLRSYGSKTFQEFLPLFSKVPFKLVATATPSPNRYKELIHYAGFLGVMDTGLALTRWFQRNSEKAGDLTLYPHKEDEFWMWVHSWAAFLQRPSELGYSDAGYELPPLKLTWHEVPADHSKAEPERDGQTVLFRAGASSLQESAKSRRDSLASRVAKMVEIIAADPDSHRIIWHDLEAEREAIEDALPRFEYVQWGEFRDGNPHARALYDRHYSARPDRDSDLILGPGDKMVLLTADHRALFGWRKFKDDSGQTGVNCAVFRNEGDLQSSDLIKEAMAIAWLRWPGERFYTFVDAEEIASVNPGYCFKQAGWRHCGKTQSGLEILEALPGCEVPAITPRVGLATITGSMDIDAREVLLHDFEEGRIKNFGTKPILSGSGSNFQYFCHKAVYVGMPGDGHKFNDFIQSLYRLQRFGQQFPVEIDIIYSEDMRAGRSSLEEKWARDTEMRARMSEIILKHGLNTLPLRDALLRSIGVKRVEIRGENFVAINDDAVAECRTWPENSVDLMVSSIPFGTQYEYSASYLDFGHSDDNGHFWSQMDFLSSELLRMLKPGRLACIHVKDRIKFGAVTGQGVPTVSPFHAEAIMHYRAHGFQYLGMITVVTDVVRENNQTYRLGWSENAKDGTKMGVGMPEYILLLRKPQSDRTRSYADVPVVKSKDDYTRARWQIDAHGFWRSSGNRHLTPDEFAQCSSADLAKLFSKTTVDRVYDFESHVAIGEAVERTGTLPATFMAIAPGSHHPDVWHDVNRMRTLNMNQARKGQEMHLCLARGSRVLTRRAGYVPIEEVEIGDDVLTHRGRWRPVTVKANTGVRPVVTLKAQGVPGLTLTPDHKLWTRKVTGGRWAEDHSRRQAAIVDPWWLEAGETAGSYINLKLPPTEVHETESLRFWWTVGRWLADGHYSTAKSFVISCGHHEVEGLKLTLGPYAGKFRNTGTASQTILRDPTKKLFKVLRACGRGAAGKHLPAVAFTLPVVQADALLSGYMSGDGHFLEERQRWMASSISRDLLLGVAMLVQRVHGAIAAIYSGRKPGTTFIQGRKVTTRQDWILSYDLPHPERSKGLPFVMDDGAWKKVRTIEPAGEIETWCLRVEEDESFTAEGCIVKNCPLQFDIVDRLIERYSNPGDLVFDPFGGLMTVPYRALLKGRKGAATELSAAYFLDGVHYLHMAEEQMATPQLFDLATFDAVNTPPPLTDLAESET